MIRMFKSFRTFYSVKLMNDNFYSFSFNKTLQSLTSEQLGEIDGLKVKYIQLDSMNKCIPQDWFLGYDQFAVYTFHKLAGSKGYLKTYIRPIATKFNLFNNLKVLNVDYAKDFTGILYQDQSYFIIQYVWLRSKQLLSTMTDLTLCYSLVYISSYLFHNLLYFVT